MINQRDHWVEGDISKLWSMTIGVSSDSDLTFHIIPGGVLAKRRMAAPGLCQGSQGAVWILGWTMLNIWKPIQNLKTSICLLLQIYHFFFSACSGDVFLRFALSDISFWNRVLYPQPVGFLASTDQTRSMFWETFSWFGCTASKISYPDPGCTQL